MSLPRRERPVVACGRRTERLPVPVPASTTPGQDRSLRPSVLNLSEPWKLLPPLKPSSLLCSQLCQKVPPSSYNTDHGPCADLTCVPSICISIWHTCNCKAGVPVCGAFKQRSMVRLCCQWRQHLECMTALKF